MPPATVVRSSITRQIKNVLATNAADPAGFISFDYDDLIDRALQSLSSRITRIQREVVTVTTTSANYPWVITDPEFVDLVAVEYPGGEHPPAYLAAELHSHENTTAISPARTILLPNSNTHVWIWYSQKWSLEILPQTWYPTVVEGAAGFALRAQALAYTRQATLRPDTTRLLFAEAAQMLGRFHAAIEATMVQRQGLQIHNDQATGIKINSTKLALDAARAGNINAAASAAATLRRLNLVDQDEVADIVKSMTDPLFDRHGTHERV